MSGHEPVRWDRWTKLIAIFGAVAVVCGTVGVYKERPCQGLAQAFFHSLSVLLGHGQLEGSNWFSLLAQVFGALFACSAAIRILGPGARRQWLAFRARNAIDHNVVIGLGRKGQALLEHPRLRGEEPAGLAGRWRRWRCPVVTIDKIPAQSWETTGYGHPVRVVGDALEFTTLADANITGAAKVFIATRDDAVNLEIAGRIYEKLASVAAPNHSIFVHVADPVLRREAFPAREVAGVQATPFALSALAARQFLSRFPLAIRAQECGAPGCNVVMIGFDSYAEEMLVHALRLGRLVGQAPLRFTIFSAQAAATQFHLERTYPAFFGHAVSEFGDSVRVLTLPAGEDISAEQLRDAEPDDAPVTAVFIHAANDAECFKVALRTRMSARSHGFWKAPFFMRVDEGSHFAVHLRCLPAIPASDGIGALGLSPAKVPAPKPTPFLEAVLETYGERTPTIEGILDGMAWDERVAQFIHEDYRRKHASERRSDAQNEWWRISEEFRDANRRAADHFLLKLASSGYVVRGAIPVLPRSLAWGTATAAADPLARLEHESWCREKSLAGWRHGPVRDNSRRIHDALVPFDKLVTAKQQLDQEPIAAIQQVLTATEPHATSLGRGAQQRAIARRIDQAMASGGPTATVKANGNAVDVGPPNVFKERIIGLTGHPVVDPATARAAIAAGMKGLLNDLQAQRRLGDGGDEFWTFITPLAPGSDLILAEEVVHQLTQLDLTRFRFRIVQSLPLAAVVSFWRTRGGLQRGTVNGGVPSGDALLPGLGGTRTGDENAVVAQLRAFIQDPKNRVEAYVDMTTPELCTSWQGKPLGPALQKVRSHLLNRCHELIVACDPERWDSVAVGDTWALVQSWRDRWYKHESAPAPLPQATVESTSLRGAALTAGPSTTATSQEGTEVPGLHKIAVQSLAPSMSAWSS